MVQKAKGLGQSRQKKLRNAFFHWRAKSSPNWSANQDDQEWREKNGYPVAPLITIAYVGIWDTVKTLGLIEGKYRWHDHDLSDHVLSARHAVAIDERRVKFDYTPWDNIDDLNAARGLTASTAIDPPYQQIWFPGDHGSVGGGGPVTGLSDIALDYIRLGAMASGLVFQEIDVFAMRPDPLAPLRNREGHKPSIGAQLANKVISTFGERDRKGVARKADLSKSTLLRYFAPDKILPDWRRYRPGALKKLIPILDKTPSPFSSDDYKRLKRRTLDDAASDIPVLEHLPFQSYRVHIVEKGDALTEIAQRYLGDAKRYKEIFEANSVALDDPNELHTDMRLFIPVDILH